jgi:hypothetical protein
VASTQIIFSRNAEIFKNYLFERTNSCEKKMKIFVREY